MMHGWYGGMSGWDWVWAVFGMAALWTLAAAGVLATVRYARHSGDGTRAIEPPPRMSAREVLADRFARGEIGEDEYWQRLQTLRASDDK
jgi:putative membrane protein